MFPVYKDPCSTAPSLWRIETLQYLHRSLSLRCGMNEQTYFYLETSLQHWEDWIIRCSNVCSDLIWRHFTDKTFSPPPWIDAIIQIITLSEHHKTPAAPCHQAPGTFALFKRTWNPRDASERRNRDSLHEHANKMRKCCVCSILGSIFRIYSCRHARMWSSGFRMTWKHHQAKIPGVKYPTLKPTHSSKWCLKTQCYILFQF